MLIPERTAILFKKKQLVINSFRQSAFLGRNYNMTNNLNYNHQYTMRVLAVVLHHPLPIFFKGDLHPLGRALSWPNWSQSWVSWNLQQNNQQTLIKLNEPFLEITDRLVTIVIGSSRTELNFGSQVGTLYSKSNSDVNAVIIAAFFLWQQHVKNSTYYILLWCM